MEAAAPAQSIALTLVSYDTVVGLVQDPSAGPKTGWALRFAKGAQMAEEGRVPGFDPATMKLLPMGVPASWGRDSGPHWSAVLGGESTPTQDADGKVDDLEAAKVKAAPLVGRKYVIPLDDASYKFILGSEPNDENTNGPIMLIESFGPQARAVMNGIRAELGLGPFGEGHSIHTTICKVTHQAGHAKMRDTALVAEWPKLPDNPRCCVPKTTLAPPAAPTETA